MGLPSYTQRKPPYSTGRNPLVDQPGVLLGFLPSSAPTLSRDVSTSCPGRGLAFAPTPTIGRGLPTDAPCFFVCMLLSHHLAVRRRMSKKSSARTISGVRLHLHLRSSVRRPRLNALDLLLLRCYRRVSAVVRHACICVTPAAAAIVWSHELHHVFLSLLCACLTPCCHHCTQRPHTPRADTTIANALDSGGIDAGGTATLPMPSAPLTCGVTATHSGSARS